MIALGDLFLLLKSATDATSNVVWNAANDAWHFIVQIAEQVYHAVLDTVDAIVGTIEWIFNSVKTAITKIIRYVEFLFEWDDIRRTKDVMYNITKLFFQHQIDGISEEKKDFETMITSAEQSLGEFAGFSDWSNLGDAAKQPASANVKNPVTGQTPGSQMLGNHYRTHAGDLRIVQYPVPSSKIEKDSVQRSLDGVIEALAQKQGDNSTFAKQLGDVAKEFGLMEIKAALEKLAVIIVDGILSSTRVVVDTLLDLQKELATAGFAHWLQNCISRLSRIFLMKLELRMYPFWTYLPGSVPPASTWCIRLLPIPRLSWTTRMFKPSLQPRAGTS